CSLGIAPVSEFLVALTITITRMGISPVLTGSVTVRFPDFCTARRKCGRGSSGLRSRLHNIGQGDPRREEGNVVETVKGVSTIVSSSVTVLSTIFACGSSDTASASGSQRRRHHVRRGR